jgi:uncharacterized protein (DUF1778 family)
MATATRHRSTLNFRVQPDVEQRLKAAAEVSHLSLTEFVVGAAQAQADEVLVTHTMVPANYFDKLVAALDAPYKPNQALRDAAAQARTMVRHA